jgi:hypothetical protein
VFTGGDKRNPVQCLGDAATVEQGLPHSQGIVTRMVLPLFFFCQVVHHFQVIRIFFQPSILTIIIFPHTNTAVCNTVCSLGLAKGVEVYQCKRDALILCLHLAY